MKTFFRQLFSSVATPAKDETPPPPSDGGTELLAHNPFKDPLSIGNILIDMGKITKQQLWDAIGRQMATRQNDLLLGEMFVDMKILTEEDLKQALLVQENRRKTAKLNAALTDIVEVKVVENQAAQKEARRASTDTFAAVRDVALLAGA